MERLNHERDHIRQRRKYNKTFEHKVTKVTKNARACDASAVFSDWPLATSKLALRVGMISQWLRLSPRHPQGVTFMLVVMQGHSTPDQIDRVMDTIRQMGLTPHPMPGPTRTAIGITGNTSSIDSRTLEVLPACSS